MWNVMTLHHAANTSDPTPEAARLRGLCSHRPRWRRAAQMMGRVTVLGTAAACGLALRAIDASAASPDITPNTSGVPGIGSFREIAGGLATAGLIASGVALIISAVVWAIASNSGNFHHSQKGKTGVLYSCGAALLIGGVNLIIAFWNNIGSALH